MWLLFRIGLAVFAFLYRLTASNASEKGERLEASEGFQIWLRKIKGKRSVHQVRVSFAVTPGSTGAFCLYSENALTRLFKKLGLAQELQLSDSKFNDAIYVASDDPAFLRALKESEELQKLFMELNLKGWEKIYSDGKGFVTLSRKGDYENFPAEVSSYRNLQSLLNAIKPRFGDRNVFARRALILEAIMFVSIGLSAGALGQFILDDRPVLIHFFDFYLKALLVGLAIFGLWIFFVVQFLRGSSRAPLLIAESAFSAILCVAVVAPDLVYDMNHNLDQSPASFVEATITEKYTTRGRKGRIHHHWRLQFRENPWQMSTSMDVSRKEYDRIQPPQNVRFHIREGYFKAPYIQETEMLMGTTW